jgi:hypothetical protein
MLSDWLTDWLNEERLERAQTFCSFSFSLSLSLSLTGEKGAHTLFSGQREIERKKEWGGEM